jgi:hypothetical protein
MAVDGNWNLVMTTPMGDRKATLSVTSAGGTLTGTQGTLAFSGKVSGDSISGEMGIGPMGSFPFTGTRA